MQAFLVYPTQILRTQPAAPRRRRVRPPLIGIPTALLLSLAISLAQARRARVHCTSCRVTTVTDNRSPAMSSRKARTSTVCKSLEREAEADLAPMSAERSDVQSAASKRPRYAVHWQTSPLLRRMLASLSSERRAPDPTDLCLKSPKFAGQENITGRAKGLDEIS